MLAIGLSVSIVSANVQASGKVAAASAVAGATLATFVTLVATQGGCQTPASVTASVSVFCQAFKPIDLKDKELDQLPLYTATTIVRHNAAYKELCVRKGLLDKVKDIFRSKSGKEKD